MCETKFTYLCDYGNYQIELGFNYLPLDTTPAFIYTKKATCDVTRGI